MSPWASSIFKQKKNDEVRTFDHKHYGEEVPYQLSTVCVIDLGFI